MRELWLKLVFYATKKVILLARFDWNETLHVVCFRCAHSCQSTSFIDSFTWSREERSSKIRQHTTCLCVWSWVYLTLLFFKIGEFYVVHKRRKTDFEAPKLWNPNQSPQKLTVCLSHGPCPTSPFTILEPQNPWIRQFHELQERQATDFKAPKLWKGSSGGRHTAALLIRRFDPTENLLSSRCLTSVIERERRSVLIVTSGH